MKVDIFDFFPDLGEEILGPESLSIVLTIVIVGDGQGSLVYCNLQGCKELDTTERLNRTDSFFFFCSVFFFLPSCRLPEQFLEFHLD